MINSRIHVVSTFPLDFVEKNVTKHEHKNDSKVLKKSTDKTPCTAKKKTKKKQSVLCWLVLLQRLHVYEHCIAIDHTRAFRPLFCIRIFIFILPISRTCKSTSITQSECTQHHQGIAACVHSKVIN